MRRFSVNIVSWHSHREILTAIRNKVFIEEQKVPEELERDAKDPEYIHALATLPDQRPIGTGRLLDNGKIGRMAVLKPYRRMGVGRELLACLICAAEKHEMPQVHLEAQTHAIGFYERAGFVSYGEEFMDAGLPHIAMKKDI